MTRPLRTRFAAALLPLMMGPAGPALSAGTGAPAGTADPAAAPVTTPAGLAEARAAVDAGRYPEALRLLAAVVRAEPRNADALNLMGYSNRRMNRFIEAARWYDAALKADPRHLGALAYQGELYVETGDYARAHANLDRLSMLCGTCAEYDNLRAALVAAGQG